MRAVARPCPAVPAASPRAAQPGAPIQRSTGGPMMIAVSPVSSTNTAASDGEPPICSAMPMAIGVVTDLGASDSTTMREAPSQRAISMALAAATREPARIDGTMAGAARRMRPRLACIGTASATVAGPSRNCTYWPPWKYAAYGVWVSSSSAASRTMQMSIGLASTWPRKRALSHTESSHASRVQTSPSSGVVSR